MNMLDHTVSKPWFKQLWPWLLISGPALAAIGCMITIYLAITLYADKPVRDGVVKHGLKVEQPRSEKLTEGQKSK
ncbi:hypothetical protein [Polynucleobacter antarcticus]|uniref:FixH protein n=1 Tax=Polynucleobacter antarcticus TaxID=1743162 RepID=A0A6M9PSN2_9BURK|nr:hypothetical protein DCO16_08720 [Polynucleobacter antarcticus]